jgi:extracellular elastinolytic metalloproteinase
VKTEPEYEADQRVQRTSSGSVAVHLQQQHQGIPIFQATQTVRFNPDGTLRDTEGSSSPVDAYKAPKPSLSAVDCVRHAAEHVAKPEPEPEGEQQVDQFGVAFSAPDVDLSGFDPQLVDEDENDPRRPAVVHGAPFEGDITAELIWFPLDSGPCLAYEVLLTGPGHVRRWRVLVDANNGNILYSLQLAQTIAARGKVYRVDGSSEREELDFPLPLESYGLPAPPNLPGEFPDDWVTGDDTTGNTAHAHLDNAGPSLQGANTGDAVTFDPDDPTGDDQKVLNIFYFNCFMHDYCYLLGFDEASGNFQDDNFGRGGSSSADAVDARAHSGAVPGTANMLTLRDGEPPVMNMGLVPQTDRHTAFDSSVVFHEYMHGVTNRLVGGTADDASLSSEQSRGMGEGWSDWIACTINDSTVVGSWVVDNPQGIRTAPYDDNYPLTFADIANQSDEHTVGEVWCAALLALNREIGVPLTLRLVFDSLRIAAANPGFLDMRDDMFASLEALAAAGELEQPLEDVRATMWGVFARYGMGPNAQSQGAQLFGIVADFETP